ncbi:SH2 domain-containing adapter heavyweight isoform X2 [Rhodnius prolixus]|uniref:SH2 domain-containing adapter heavyweight isoform X2 n=1 Tax=Rhodnius prolixus TaxID=13249 RepID=UPI003D18B502
MERLLKRIKNKPDCTATTAVKTPATNDLETPDIQQPMKRNSTATSGGGGGVSPVVEFNPRLITRKLCGRKNRQDNELYRSNSFKFERFDRTDSALDLAQLTKQVSLCDDYSLPVDFVNKKRPVSIGSSPFWENTVPHNDNVEVVEVYCDPRDSKAYLEPGQEATDKLYTTPDKEYTHPYHNSECWTDSGSLCGEEAAEGGEVYENVEEEGGVVRATPYYYGDLTSDTSEDRMSPRTDEMSRRHQYETAFDSKISKSDDELDVDDVTNKSIQVASRTDSESYYKRPRSLVRTTNIEDSSTEGLRQGLSRLDLGIRPFVAPTPPSSAPLPTKFHSGICMASVQSAPDIPVRAKDLRLPIKSTKHRPRNFLVDQIQDPSRQRVCSENQENKAVKTRGLDILEIKSRTPRRMKYSSTESMATSSSGGSLESIRSSTSEGNRSTSSCESRRSSSLSSHSSDSAGSGTGAFHPALNTLSTRVFQQNKLNILSPISDKSSQEPCSETSENNKNNNSEKASPEEAVTPIGEKKRRTPQNRNLINLGLCFDQEAHQGSDSGISIESRVGNINPLDFGDLPFDMPKLRRRRLLQESTSVQDTSGSATSVDLHDLPFDMPKLKRRLRPPPPGNPAPAQPSSSTAFPECKNCMSRPSLSLDLQDSDRRRPSLGLEFSQQPPVTYHQVDPVDTSLPLEQQGWYHGAITRLEAENILRMNREGSFLVRNSESTKQDYSLSLKSARGFMHMRIQQCKETGKYILGQFSNPFQSIPEMIKHYSLNRLPIRGAEHMCLTHPVIEQLL